MRNTTFKSYSDADATDRRAQLTWLISSIPLLAYSNTSSLGCTAVVIAAEFGPQGAASEDSWLRLSAPLAASLRSHASRRAVFLPHRRLGLPPIL